MGKVAKTNKWLERNFHRTPIEYGDVEYEELDRILNSLKLDHIYVKGEQKRVIIQKYIPEVDVIKYGGPGLSPNRPIMQ